MADEPQQLVSESAGAGLGALVGGLSTLAGADANAVVAWSTGGAAGGPFVAAAIRRSAAEVMQRAPMVTEAAMRRSELSEAELLARLESDGDLQPLVQRIFEAIARTGDQRKLQILGTVLGEAIDERPRALDESILIVETVDSLQPVHMRVMEALNREPENVPADHASVWTPELLEAAVHDVSGFGIQGALAGLVGHGLATSSTGFGGGMVVKLSDFGRAMLDVIRAAVPNDQQPARTGPQRASASEDTDRSCAERSGLLIHKSQNQQLEVTEL